MDSETYFFVVADNLSQVGELLYVLDCCTIDTKQSFTFSEFIAVKYLCLGLFERYC